MDAAGPYESRPNARAYCACGRSCARPSPTHACAFVRAGAPSAAVPVCSPQRNARWASPLPVLSFSEARRPAALRTRKRPHPRLRRRARRICRQLAPCRAAPPALGGVAERSSLRLGAAQDDPKPDAHAHAHCSGSAVVVELRAHLRIGLGTRRRIGARGGSCTTVPHRFSMSRIPPLPPTHTARTHMHTKARKRSQLRAHARGRTMAPPRTAEPFGGLLLKALTRTRARASRARPCGCDSFAATGAGHSFRPSCRGDRSPREKESARRDGTSERDGTHTKV